MIKAVKKIILLFLFICCSGFIRANENPLLKLAGRPNHEIADYIAIHNAKINYAQSTEKADSLLNMVKEVARETKEYCWELEAEYSSITYRNREQLRFRSDNDYPMEEWAGDITRLLEKGRAETCYFVSVRCLVILMEAYRNREKNFEKAFDYARQLTEEIEPIDAAEFPDKLDIYILIGELHYHFQDYEEAKAYSEKVLKDKEIALQHYNLHQAYNLLALIARDYDKDIEQSNEWNRKILALPPVGNEQHAWKEEAWRGIASCNLANNLFAERKYDEAIPYFRTGIEIMYRLKDYYFVSGSAVTLAEIYLIKNDLAAAKEMLDLTAQCIDNCPYRKRFHLYYPVLSRYYEAKGEMKQALAYKDSSLWAQEQYNQEYNALQLVRSEQRAHRMEQQIKTEELKAVELRNQNYRKIIGIVTVSLLAVLCLLLYSIRLYRKKKSAYKELIRKAQAWAETPISISPATSPQPLITDDQITGLTEKIENLMEKDKIYLDATLTLDMLADKLKVNRVYLSQAFNYGIGKKFNDYINEYRVQESIRILSMDASRQYSIETIASMSGFNDRKTFYRVFKKITGLSPTEYWKGIKE